MVHDRLNLGSQMWTIFLNIFGTIVYIWSFKFSNVNLNNFLKIFLVHNRLDLTSICQQFFIFGNLKQPKITFWNFFFKNRYLYLVKITEERKIMKKKRKIVEERRWKGRTNLYLKKLHKKRKKWWKEKKSRKGREEKGQTWNI